MGLRIPQSLDMKRFICWRTLTLRYQFSPHSTRQRFDSPFESRSTGNSLRFKASVLASFARIGQVMS